MQIQILIDGIKVIVDKKNRVITFFGVEKGNVKNIIQRFKELYFKKENALFYELKEVGDLLNVKRTKMLSLLPYIERYCLYFESVMDDGKKKRYVSNIKYLVHQDDLYDFLMNKCKLEYVKRILVVGLDTNTTVPDAFYRKRFSNAYESVLGKGIKSREDKTATVGIFEQIQSKEETAKLVNLIVRRRVSILSRQVLSNMLTKKPKKTNDENVDKSDTVDHYGATSIERLLKSVSVLKIGFPDARKLAKIRVIIEDPEVDFPYFQEIIAILSKNKVVSMRELGYRNIELDYWGEFEKNYSFVELIQAIRQRIKDLDRIDVLVEEVQGLGMLNKYFGVAYVDLYQVKDRMRILLDEARRELKRTDSDK